MVPLISLLILGTQGSTLDRHIYPLAPAMKCPPVVVDASDFPEGKPWGDKAKTLVEMWFGKLTELLATDGRDPVTKESKGRAFSPPTTLRLVIKKEINVPAYTSGGTITINGKWITDHPEDLGLVIHELVHVIQNYPGARTTPGWLVEGIADYIRWWRYEPELHATTGRTKVNPDKAKYTDSYRTTAVWLAWCARKYDMRLVPCLDKAMRDREDPLPLFAKLTGKAPDELWKEFVAALP